MRNLNCTSPPLPTFLLLLSNGTSSCISVINCQKIPSIWINVMYFVLQNIKIALSLLNLRVVILFDPPFACINL
jgi:hypothetical protein